MFFLEANICPLFPLLCVWLSAFLQSYLFHSVLIVVHKEYGMPCGQMGEVADLGILGTIFWLDIVYTLMFKSKFLDLEILSSSLVLIVVAFLFTFTFFQIFILFITIIICLGEGEGSRDNFGKSVLFIHFGFLGSHSDCQVCGACIFICLLVWVWCFCFFPAESSCWALFYLLILFFNKNLDGIKLSVASVY